MRRIPVALCCVVVVMASCTKPAKLQQTQSVVSASEKHLVFLTREGCVNTRAMRANLDEALRALGQTINYEVIDLGALPESDPRAGYPTPTVLYENRDLFGMPEPPGPHPPGT
jgi:hypothetical protein